MKLYKTAIYLSYKLKGAILLIEKGKYRKACFYKNFGDWAYSVILWRYHNAIRLYLFRKHL